MQLRTVDVQRGNPLEQLREVEPVVTKLTGAALAAAWRSAARMFNAEPCPQREGFPKVESDSGLTVVAAAAGTVLALALIFIVGGAA